MNRIFLAFMALLAGLAAQVTPAAARVSEDTQIGAASDARQLEGHAAVFASTAETRSVQTFTAETRLSETALEAQVPAATAVLIGIDRARE